MKSSQILHKYLELIRRLERRSFIFTIDPKTATDIAKNNSAPDASTFDKLIYRAELIDSDGSLLTTLHRAVRTLTGVQQILCMIYFITGMVGVYGLLSIREINFYYVLFALLGWHSATLIWWFIRTRHHEFSWLDNIYDGIKARFGNKNTAYSTALEIELEHFYVQKRWQIGKVTHQAWLAGLIGSLVALLLLFLTKAYEFTWQSTLLGQTQYTQTLQILSFIPNLLGFNLNPFVEISDAKLAQLLMFSVILYGIIPRFFAYLYCYWHARNNYEIDGSLYYYEQLVRIFNQRTVSPDDYTPTTYNKIQTATVSTGTKVVAMLERPARSDKWYAQGAGTQVQDVGVLDTKDDFMQALQMAQVLNAQIYLGIDTASLPDRGILRKLNTLVEHAPYGIVVELLGTGEHTQAWQEALASRGIGLIKI